MQCNANNGSQTWTWNYPYYLLQLRLLFLFQRSWMLHVDCRHQSGLRLKFNDKNKFSDIEVGQLFNNLHIRLRKHESAEQLVHSTVRSHMLDMNYCYYRVSRAIGLSTAGKWTVEGLTYWPAIVRVLLFGACVIASDVTAGGACGYGCSIAWRRMIVVVSSSYLPCCNWNTNW